MRNQTIRQRAFEIQLALSRWVDLLEKRIQGTPAESHWASNLTKTEADAIAWDLKLAERMIANLADRRYAKNASSGPGEAPTASGQASGATARPETTPSEPPGT